MFEFDAGKLILVAIVALIVIGPKDLPRVLRQLGAAVGKLRRMAAEFQGQFMDAMREADQEQLKKEILDIADSTKKSVGDFNPVRDLKAQMEGALNPPAAETPAAPALEGLEKVETPAAVEETIAASGTGPGAVEAPQPAPAHAGAIDLMADLRNMTAPPAIDGFDDMRTPMIGAPPRPAPPNPQADARDEDDGDDEDATMSTAPGATAAARARAARAARSGRARRLPGRLAHRSEDGSGRSP